MNSASIRWLLCAPLVACQLATDFELSPVAETTAALCSDGRDNDFDGLTDCQDWRCLDQPVCCDIPEILLVDEFDAEVSCDSATCVDGTCSDPTCTPDDALWHAFPCPYARVCDGALWPVKQECFDGGVLSEAAVPLEPGLVVEAELLGRPETMGYQVVGLTVQTRDDFPGSLDPCQSSQALDAFVSIRHVAAPDGYRLVAELRGEDIGSALVTGDPETPRAVSIAVDDERRAVFSLEGQPFATSDGPLPAAARPVRLALMGRTGTARIASVRILAGRRCHDPTAWTPVGGDIAAAVALAPAGGADFVWDRDAVFHPAVRAGDEATEAFYTGCFDAAGGCDPLFVAIGRARVGDDGLWSRVPDNPVFEVDQLPEELSSLHSEMDLGLVAGDPAFGYLSPTGGETDMVRLDLGDQLSVLGIALRLGTREGWDGFEICCATGLVHEGTYYVWYAGRPRNSTSWRIGLATSPDGVELERHPANPVLDLGGVSAFDSEAVLHPSVVFDPDTGLFRMWYQGRDFFGDSHIGYAVSTDGVTWSKYPGNPAFSAVDLGLETVESPAVLLGQSGTLSMWVSGVLSETATRQVFALDNAGRLTE